MDVKTSLLVKFGLPILIDQIQNIAVAVVTEDNLRRCQAKVHDALTWLTGKTATKFDDELVATLEKKLSDPAFIAEYGDRLLDPIEEFIVSSSWTWDDRLLPFISQLREVAHIPDNDE